MPHVTKSEVKKAIGMNNGIIKEKFALKFDSFIKITVLHKNLPIANISVQLIQNNVVKYTLTSDENGYCESKIMAGTYLVHPVFDSSYTIVVDDTVNAPVFGEVSAKVIGLQEGELTWSLYRDYVQNGTIKNFIAIGDEVDVVKGNSSITYQHVAYDKMTMVDPLLSHNSVIQMKNCWEGSTIQWCAAQAFIYAKTTMPAGTTFHVNLYKPSNIYYLNAGLQNKNLQFTITKEIPQGGQLVVSAGSFNNSTTVEELELTSYASAGSTTILEAGIACIEGTDGTDLGNANTVANNDRVNSTDRCVYGSNYWGTCAFRQWANSNQPRGQWWQPLSIFDRRPAIADSIDGFMYDLDPELVAVIKPVKNTVALNWFDGGGTEVFEDLIFVPSRSQIYMDSNTTEGVCWDYYDSQANGGFSDLTSPGTGEDSNRIKTRGGNATYWWDRTPHSSYSGGEYSVGPTGANSLSYSTSSTGASLACCIAA